MKGAEWANNVKAFHERKENIKRKREDALKEHIASFPASLIVQAYSDMITQVCEKQSKKGESSVTLCYHDDHICVYDEKCDYESTFNPTLRTFRQQLESIDGSNACMEEMTGIAICDEIARVFGVSAMVDDDGDISISWQ